jgi:hypothetical protein
MELLDQKTDDELLKSLLAEIAKTTREIKCAQQDIDKAISRMGFSLVLINTLINRKEK